MPIESISFTECCVGLVFSSCAAAIQGTSVTWTKTVFSRPSFLAHLADGFEEGQGFDIADGAADFDDGHVTVRRDLAHGVLDLIGDVGDDLDGLAEVVAAALLGDDLLVDAAGGQVVVAGELGVG